jgi:hypothetical protein
MSRKIIGQGLYGCVHKPSIQCDKLPKPKFNYNNYVSKIMKTKNAKKELEEFLIIDRIDPHEKYHLGEPIMCKPKINKLLIKDIEKCRHITDFEVNQNDYSLLLLKYGGYDLKTFCSYIPEYFSTNKTDKLNKLLLEFHDMLKGINLFKRYGLVHYDLKPQNILFNVKTGKMYFIDFGLMNDKKTIIQKSIKSENPIGIFHWSYPLENGFSNKIYYDKYFKAKKHKRKTIQKELTDMIISDSKVNNYELPLQNPLAFKTIFTYLNLKNVVLPNEVQLGYINSFFEGLNKNIDHFNYHIVLDKIIDSIDIYGLGMSLQYLVNCLMRMNIIDNIQYNKLTIFLNKMWNFDLSERNIDIPDLIKEYENVLLELGVLTQLNVHFENNSVKTGPPNIPKSKSGLTEEKPLSQVLEKQAHLDAIELGSTKFIEGKEMNPTSNKKCKERFTRNAKFCSSKKSKKTIKNKNYQK